MLVLGFRNTPFYKKNAVNFTPFLHETKEIFAQKLLALLFLINNLKEIKNDQNNISNNSLFHI